MQDKTLENSTDIWWIKCLFVVGRFDEMMTNFVLNVCKSEPKFWVNIIQHADTCELSFSFYQSDFLWCCFYVTKQAFNYRIMCIYLHLYVNIIDSLFFSLQIFTIFYILTLKLNGFKLICSFIRHVKCSKWTKIPFNRRAFLLWCSYKIAKKILHRRLRFQKLIYHYKIVPHIEYVFLALMTLQSPY